ncbi:hypothetical protein [Bernardetia sp.]|uniref:hypothetical protein n=1 Tax=Bernardetia sp. TaxID=1937974 RepID=UPI0025C406C6|nr:hypothetical protein [Bernardetia sp.]
MPSFIFSCTYFFSSLLFRYFFGFFLLFFFQIWSTWKGVGKTFDSWHYLKAAQNLVQHQEFIQDKSYTTWALGFPFLLTIFKDSVLLNLLCIVGTYTFFFSLSEKLFEKTATKWWLTLVFAFSTPLYLIHHFVWSEAPFVLFLVGCVWSFYFFAKNNFSKKYAFLFCLFGFLFMSMRNAGLYFIAAINLGILFFYLFPSIKKQKSFFLSIYKNPYTRISILFTLFSSISIWFWWFRAKPTTAGKFATMYSLAERTLAEEIMNYSDILSRWFVPPAIPLTIRMLLLFVVFILSLAVLVSVFRNSENKNHYFQFVSFLSWVISFYLIGMLITRTGMRVDAERYLAILYPFLALFLGYILEKINVKNHLKYTLAFLWLIYPLLRTLKNIIFWN